MTTTTAQEKVCANPDCDNTFKRRPDQRDSAWTKKKYCDPRCYVDPHGSNRRRGTTEHTVSDRYFLDNGPGDLSWQDQAACRYHDPELFQPVGTTGPALAQTAQAKAVCRACPVVMECALWAIDALEDGIAGAMTPEERRRFKRGDTLTEARAS